MAWIEYLILMLVFGAGVFLTLFTLPGIWLMVGAAGIYAWLAPSPHLGKGTLGVMLGLAALAELVELVSASRATKKSGGSRRAGIGALVGGIVGGLVLSVPVPVFGTIIGICIGVFVGALVMEFTKHGQHGKSLKVGAAAAGGRLVGAIVKVGIAVGVFLIGAVMGWPI